MIRRTLRSRRWIALSILAPLLSPSMSPSQEAAAVERRIPVLTAAQWTADLQVLAERLPEVHRDAFHTISRDEFQREIDDLERRIPAIEDHEVIVELARIAASIGDGHTGLLLTDHERNGFRRYPIVLYDFTDGLHLVAAPRSLAHAVGGRVTRIGNTDTEEALRRVAPLVPRDNEMGVRRLGPLYLRIPEVLEALGLIDDMERGTFTIEKDGRQMVVELEPVAAGRMPDRTALVLPADGSRLGEADLASMRDSQAPVPLYLRHPETPYWFEWIPENRMLYVQSNGISNDGEIPMAEFFAHVFAAADSLPLERLVIDVRNNGGGNNMLNAPVVLGIVRRPEIDREDRLFVVIGRTTFSAASHLVTYLERFTHATFVGEPTGGSPNHFGDARRIELPNSGLRVAASTIYWQNSLPVPFEERVWTPPEIAAQLTSADWAQGIDPALEAIVVHRPEEPLTETIARAGREGGPEAALAAFEEWKADPVHAYATVERELNSAGYRLMDENRVDEAVAVLYVNARAYPESVNVWDSLGDAYRTAGRAAEAIEAYERAAAMDPNGSLGASAGRKAEELRGT